MHSFPHTFCHFLLCGGKGTKIYIFKGVEQPLNVLLDRWCSILSFWHGGFFLGRHHWICGFFCLPFIVRGCNKFLFVDQKIILGFMLVLLKIKLLKRSLVGEMHMFIIAWGIWAWLCCISLSLANEKFVNLDWCKILQKWDFFDCNMLFWC